MDEKLIIEALSNMKYGCCGQPCKSEDVSVMEHREGLLVLSVYCPSCEKKGLVAVVIEEGEVPEAATELTEAEKSGFSAPISSDDVLDMHLFLKDFSRYIFSLLSEE